MRHRYSVVPVLAVCLVPFLASADTLDRDISGTTPAGQAVSMHVHVDFTPTGGNFTLGTGTATVAFTLENTSGLYPFQSPVRGNPLLTGFLFNVPPSAVVAYTEARILAGGTEFDPGSSGNPTPNSCTQLGSDDVRTSWYIFTTGVSTGLYGIFTDDVSTSNGINEGIVDPEVIVNCVQQGDVVAGSAVAGKVRFTFAMSHLGTTLDSAQDFLFLCSTAHGDHISSSFGGHFQGCDNNGQGSAYVGDSPCPTPVQALTWGGLKTIYR